ncbi:hypothetical protein ACFSUD_17435 [Sulfitobacter aestuarii]|uniref:Antibiotic biosynthesis monooxygenase n=1 Tax=Sulfitobacter aestuarii TaxID=2161676 RepID=A0ABW5U657_9RHOB
MPNDARPVLSIIVRRFHQDRKADILHSLHRLQQVAADQPGYLGDHNSLSEEETQCELVNVFAFNSRKNLERWEASELRNRCLAELDRHPQKATRHKDFEELARLLPQTSRISKIEIVVILIFWILISGTCLGYLGDLLLPTGFPAVGRSILLVTINVLLISYLFLPWTSNILTKLKTARAERVPKS